MEDSTNYLDITQQLRKMCLDFELDDLAYFVDFINLKSKFPSTDFNQIFYKCTDMRTSIFISSYRVREYFDCWEHRWMKKDHNIKELPFKNPHHWRYRDSSEHSPSPGNDLKRFGYKHKVSYEVPCPLCPDLVARFTLFPGSEASLQRVLDKDPRLTDSLELLHCRSAIKLAREDHPIQQYRLIKPTSAKVLYLLSQGHGRENVAKLSNLTPRGIDYHIDVLKEKLGANNQAHLVSIAKSKYLL